MTRPSERNGTGAQDPSSLSSGRVPSPATGGINGSNQTRKGPSDSIADYQKLWAPGTQMSQADWAETCRRAEDNLGTKQ